MNPRSGITTFDFHLSGTSPEVVAHLQRTIARALEDLGLVPAPVKRKALDLRAEFGKFRPEALRPLAWLDADLAGLSGRRGRKTSRAVIDGIATTSKVVGTGLEAPVGHPTRPGSVGELSA